MPHAVLLCTWNCSKKDLPKAEKLFTIYFYPCPLPEMECSPFCSSPTTRVGASILNRAGGRKNKQTTTIEIWVALVLGTGTITTTTTLL